MIPSALRDTWSAHRDRVEAALSDRVAAWRRGGWPGRLVDACAYALAGGGKRVRPVLALMAAEAVGGVADAALPWALALELVHTYSLVHDDLPAMDDDDLRRGRPSCHRQFDEALAILAGDALLTEAFQLIAPDGVLVARLALAAGGQGMVAGQVLDVGEPPDTLAALEALHRQKTGALIRAAVEGGALAAGARPDLVEIVGRFGGALGLLFQITDDLLDREQDAERGGNSYLHHLDDAAVLARRDALIGEALAALVELGPGGRGLATVVDYIAHREA